MRPKVIVIGAGAAGLAAARNLHDAGCHVLVIEARNRIGGRIWTRHDLAAYPIELGAESIHGDRVITWEYLDRYDLQAVPDYSSGSSYLYKNGQLINADIIPGYPDNPLSRTIESIANEWITPETEEMDVLTMLALWKSEHVQYQGPVIDDTWGLLNSSISHDWGADIDELSAQGIIELSYAGDGTGNFRVEQGYSALVDRLSAGLDILYNMPVSEIAWSNERVQITCSTGQTFHADQVVITLPLGVLQAGDVRFDPPLPPDKRSAIAGLGSAHVNKIIMRFSQPVWPADMACVLTPLDSQLWWRPGWDRSNETPILSALMGGRDALYFEELGDEAIPVALEHLTQLFGADVPRYFVDGHLVAWGNDPFAKMGYSYIPLNGCGLRAQLAEPIGHVLYFAGEATHVTRAATVHGALESGQHAATAIMARRTNTRREEPQ